MGHSADDLSPSDPPTVAAPSKAAAPPADLNRPSLVPLLVLFGTLYFVQGIVEPTACLPAQPIGFWSRLSAVSCPLAFASGRRVGDRPLSGKETGPARVVICGSWGLPHHERLGNRAVSYYLEPRWHGG